MVPFLVELYWVMKYLYRNVQFAAESFSTAVCTHMPTYINATYRYISDLHSHLRLVVGGEHSINAAQSLEDKRQQLEILLDNAASACRHQVDDRRTCFLMQQRMDDSVTVLEEGHLVRRGRWKAHKRNV
jgi:hypothetical protein